MESTIQKAFAGKPIMVIAKASDSILPRQIGLSFAGFRKTKIVKSEIGRQVRLVMAAKKRARLCNVRPLGKSFTPPCIILGYRMILRQVKGDRPQITSHFRFSANHPQLASPAEDIHGQSADPARGDSLQPTRSRH